MTKVTFLPDICHIFVKTSLLGRAGGAEAGAGRPNIGRGRQFSIAVPELPVDNPFSAPAGLSQLLRNLS
ncbi:MAG TPA: hypothetical protein VEC93_21250 [Anaerolineae bacterium]|nr:hypothetical protein [Anaerolineae bacterium]